MRFRINIHKKPTSCRLIFRSDGSFGQSEPVLYLDYEINLSRDGSLEIFGSKGTNVCYCLEGFSWKYFMKAKGGQIILNNIIDGQLCFMLDENDYIDYGTHYDKEFKLALLDHERKLVLYGDHPLNAKVVRFAFGQYVCWLCGEPVGFIIDYSDAIFETNK